MFPCPPSPAWWSTIIFPSDLPFEPHSCITLYLAFHRLIKTRRACYRQDTESAADKRVCRYRYRESRPYRPLLLMRDYCALIPDDLSCFPSPREREKRLRKKDKTAPPHPASVHRLYRPFLSPPPQVHTRILLLNILEPLPVHAEEKLVPAQQAQDT